ncbi:Cystinosin lysosomal cystine transporter [Paragonimus heterotremus]|uniref:Cystinosin lysosomal cystine transporter n=1 Tax=Paragonimus heterotremus TaxID=100268 RepID=A0A8J4TD38_9TREM|nr:Cystinosin lysosomal cystine transporter [Paragonimus heterotremus]
MNRCLLLIITFVTSSLASSEFSVSFSKSSLSLELNEVASVNISLNKPAPQTLIFAFTYRDSNGDYVKNVNNSAVRPLDAITILAGQTGPVNVTVAANKPGRVYLGLNETGGSDIFENLDRVTCNVLVMHLSWLDGLQIAVGWIYFVAWTVSFYPQVFLNWKRKSVVGFNLDFLCLNLVGFLVYSVFNLALFASPAIKEEYARLHPIGVIPVMVNDIFFSVHAFLICGVTGVQVLIYERGGQRVSRVCIVILCLIGVYCIINAIVAGANAITWLTFLFNISYVKLFITFIKYVPQAVMNCRRRSTVGWSIGNICLDLTGGTLSILQMFIVAYNFDDWSSGFGSPTKLGLGLFSITFDIFFMVQHWCLYPHGGEQAVPIITGVSSTESYSQAMPNYQSVVDYPVTTYSEITVKT